MTKQKQKFRGSTSTGNVEKKSAGVESDMYTKVSGDGVRRSSTVSNAEEQTLKQDSNSPSQASIMQPAETIESTTPEPAGPQSPMSVTTAPTPGQETVSIPAITLQNIVMEMTAMRDEINNLKMTGHIVPSGPRSRLDQILDIVSNIAQAAGKVIPQQDGGMNSRFMDYVFRGFEENLSMSSIVKEGVAKQLGVTIAPRAVHMSVLE